MKPYEAIMNQKAPSVKRGLHIVRSTVTTRHQMAAEKPTFTEAQLKQMMELFQGNTKARGQFRPNGTVSNKGKAGGKSYTETLPPDAQAFRAHLNGAVGLGIVLINEANECKIADIDVDDYKLDHVAMLKKIRDLKLPLNMFASKSGGAHLGLFADKPMPAAAMRKAALSFVKPLGLKSTESGGTFDAVYPKQDRLAQDPTKGATTGSWINLPYFNTDQRQLEILDEHDNLVKVPLADFFSKVQVTPTTLIARLAEAQDDAAEEDAKQTLRQQALDLTSIAELVAFLPPAGSGTGNTYLYAAAFAAGVLRRDEKIATREDAEGPIVEAAVRRGTPMPEATKTFASGFDDGIASKVRRTFWMNAKGTFYQTAGPLGPIERLLANFSAKILLETQEDDGSDDLKRDYLIRATLADGREIDCEVPSSDFESLGWVSTHCGAGAIIVSQPSYRGKLREAIQTLSKPERRVRYVHTGWRKVNGKMVYLHGGGAIGASNVEVDLKFKTLAPFILPEPPEAARRTQAAKSAIRFMDIARPEIMVPLFCAVWDSVLGPSPINLGIFGLTGTGKTTVAALMQNHFGSAFCGPENGVACLPGGWRSTTNSNERLAFVVKDALCVLDEYKPKGGRNERTQLELAADNLLQSKANGDMRGRLDAKSNIKHGTPARALIVMTGEDLPPGSSLRARLQMVELVKDDLMSAEASRRVTAAMHEAHSGHYACAMAAYIAWLAPQVEKLQESRQAEMEALRREFSLADHERVNRNGAELYRAATIFFRFALEIGAVDQSEHDARLGLIKRTLLGALGGQMELIEDENPVPLFLDTLRERFLAGGIYLTDFDDQRPEHAEQFGWFAERSVSFGDSMWQPRGTRVGFYEAEFDRVWLLPDVAHQAVVRAGVNMPLGSKTLQKRMKEQGHLALFDPDHATVRRRRQTNSGRYLVVKGHLLREHAQRQVTAGGRALDSNDPAADYFSYLQ